ncbi:MAG: 3-hydroxybutyryl-CoA dehydrogenase [Saprospiraceae bacterium]|nr:3-hydroxybutyryl-CoA dehydrogenase [Saprospiraceae bacterium]
MEKIGIVGGGAMGSGIAQVAATAGHPVVVYDIHESALERSRVKLASIMSRLVEKNKISDREALSIQQKIQYTQHLEDVAKADLVIEAVVEHLEVKQKIFKALDAQMAPNSILASNTSSLSVASIAAACEHPERVIGIHFFNPAPLMKLVEIIPAVQTDAATVSSAISMIKNWGKTTVVAKDTPGFIVNRVARPFYGEAIRILEEGIADVATIDWAMTTIGGFRMGPFSLMDYIGHDVNYTVTETVFKAFYYDPRYRPSFTQKRLSEAGYLGRKAGRGFYDYTNDKEKLHPRKDNQLGQAIVQRIVVMLINEAADALFWQVASRDDIDLAMVKGVNYPQGLLQWADEWGIDHCVMLLDKLYEDYREDRYRCSPLLRRMAKNAQGFYSAKT